MPTLTSQGKDDLNAFFNELGQGSNIPAFVAGATTADGEIYFNAAGSKIVNDPSSGTVDPDAVFWVCSMTKLLTHLAALQLIEAGKLDPETPVEDIVPQIKNPVITIGDDGSVDPPKVSGPATTIMRVKNLLNFTNGIYMFMRPTAGTMLNPVLTNTYEMDDKHTAFINTLKGKLPGVGLSFEPGTDFVYGHGSDILGFVIENITGGTLDAYMQKHIFQPLGITASFYLTGSLKEKLLPIAYRRFADNGLEPFADQPNTGIIPQDPKKVLCLGGAGLYMSLRDYLSVLQHILQVLNGTATSPIISLATAKSLFVPTLSPKGEESATKVMAMSGAPLGTSWGNAMALTTVDWPGRRRVGSGHWGGWLGTNFWIDPTTGIAGVTGVQLMGPYTGVFDPEVVKAGTKFEETLYGSLRHD